MAYYNEDELYRYFDKAIKEQAKLRIDDLKREIDYAYQKAMKKYKEDLAVEQNLEYSRGLRELRIEYQSQINQIGTTYDSELIKKRLEMSDHIFLEVVKKIQAFIKTKQYETYIKHKIVTVLKDMEKTEYVFKVSPKDAHIKDIILSMDKNYKVEVDQTILYGGFTLYLPEFNLEINETLDVKLEEQKDWFFKHSKLFIRA